jgi:uncharacterized membrane protein
MKKKRETSRLVRLARAHVRLWISLALGVAVGVVVAAIVPRWSTAVVAGWDLGVACYLVMVGVTMANSSIADIKRHAAEQDEGAFGLLLLTVGAAVASLIAIFAELAGAASSKSGYATAVPLLILTVALSWTFTHTIFALHYAHQFYGAGGQAEGLKFPGGGQPDYWDFIYFAFVIGMTFQVSDVAVTGKRVRRTVIAHGVVAFVFATAIIALTVNMAASALPAASSSRG